MALKGWPYDNLNILSEDLKANGVSLPLSENVEVLKQELEIDGAHKAPNRLAIQPMEGCDGDHENGAPAELTWRRYERFAQGGAGLIWFEAVAIVREGRANPRQLMITEDNLEDYKRMVAMIKEESMKKYGYAPLVIMQATHSGRYSKPEGTAAPMVAYRSPIFEKDKPLDPSRIVTDEYLKALEEKYGRAARLAQEAGFDGVDIKACHRYLLSELLSARNRGGKYGGSFENRIRLLLNIIEAVKAEVGSDMIVASRFNAFDVHPYPYGFGSAEDGSDVWDDREPVALTQRMVAAGVGLLSASAGNPYYRRPNVTRPFDLPTEGGELPPEHPMQSVARLFAVTKTIQQAAGSVPVVGTGYSWLRQFIPYAAAANLQDHACKMVGLGRSSIAYPDAPADLFRDGCFHAEKCCVACSKCTQIMRDHGETGCVIRDSAQFAPKYAQYRKEAIARAQTNAGKEGKR